jgi:hypothetical protein
MSALVRVLAISRNAHVRSHEVNRLQENVSGRRRNGLTGLEVVRQTQNGNPDRVSEKSLDLSADAGRHFFDAQENSLSGSSCEVHHFIGAPRRTADPEACVTSPNQIARNRVKDLIKNRITDLPGSGAVDQR